jgi:hypothetical protein
MEQTWVKANGSLLHDTRYNDPDKLAVTLWKDHEFAMKTAYLAATTLSSVNAPANKDELLTEWTSAMTQKSGWKGHERLTRPKLDAAVKHCTSEIAGPNPRAMTVDPIRGIPLDERPNMTSLQLPQKSVSYILGHGHQTLRGLQTKHSGVTCFFDEHAANPTIRCWGDFTAVDGLDTEIKESIMYQRARAGKAGKGGAGYPHGGVHGKGNAGMIGPYGKGGMHGKGGMQDQHVWYGNYAAW